MGRELRRKQAKKDGKSLEREEIIEEGTIRKYAMNILIIVGIFSIIYLLSALFITKELDWFKKDKEKEEEKTTSSDTILAASIFKQAEEEYYVYLYDFGEDKSEITDLVNANLGGNALYKVDTSSAMNANYVSDVSNKAAKTLEELKVVAPTLIKVSGDTIAEYYEKEEIKNKLS